jgi:hypothetical protein
MTSLMGWTLEEAKEWFLENAKGKITCCHYQTNQMKECNSYPEAKKFYEECEKLNEDKKTNAR